MTFDVCAWWTQRTGQTMSGKKSEFAQWLRELEETIRKHHSGCGEATGEAITRDLVRSLKAALPYMEGLAEKLSIASNSPEVIHLHEQIVNARVALAQASSSATEGSK